MKLSLKSIDFLPADRDNYIILLTAPLLLTIYYYNGRAGMFLHYFPSFNGTNYADIYSFYWQFGIFFLLMGMLPFLYLINKKKYFLKDVGLGIGDWKIGLFLVLLITPVIIALIWIASGMPSIQSEYPMLRSLLHDRSKFWPYEVAYLLFYYISWEFYFRGFLLFSLAKKMGKVNALLIQTALSCLVHLGKPEEETLGAIVVGVLFGWIAFNTRSIWYVFILHACIGIFTDYFSLLHIGSSY